jgi:hypothetical protein
VSAPLKRCSCGKAVATLRDWLALPFVGLMDDGDGFVIEMRNCGCRSTMAIEAPTVFDAVVPTLLIVDGEREIARTKLWNTPMSGAV